MFAVALCICAVLLWPLTANPVIKAIGVEEVAMKNCSGFVWRLQFELAVVDSQAHSFYAQYWPRRGEPLDPGSEQACTRSGGKQKLRSKVLTVRSAATGTINLFRLRNATTYYVELIHASNGKIGWTLIFTPVYKNCNLRNSVRNTSYGYFTSPLIRFDRSPFFYWIDQTGVLVHVLGSYQRLTADNTYESITPCDRPFISSPYSHAGEGKRYLMACHHEPAPTAVFVSDALGVIERKSFALSAETCLRFHHEAQVDTDDPNIIYFLASHPKLYVPPITNRLGDSICSGITADSTIVRRWNVKTGLDETIFSLDCTTNNSLDSLIDAVRDDDVAENLPDRNISLTCMEYPFRTGCLQEGVGGSGYDLLHANSFKRAMDGSKRFLLSLRSLSLIVILSEHLKPLYAIGGNARHHRAFTFPNPSHRFIGQHTAILEKDGTVLVFDNGLAHDRDTRNNSARALRLQLDYQAMTATQVWEFGTTRQSGLLGVCCGSVSRNPAGNVITHDSFPGLENPFSIYEADGRRSNTPVAIATFPAPRIPTVRYVYRSMVDTDIDGERVICDLDSSPNDVVGQLSEVSGYYLVLMCVAILIVLFRCQKARSMRVFGESRYR